MGRVRCIDPMSGMRLGVGCAPQRLRSNPSAKTLERVGRSGCEVTPSRRRSLHEAAHKIDHGTRDEAGRSPARVGERRSFNEAGHKLGYWAPPSLSDHDQASASEATRRRFEALADTQRAMRCIRSRAQGVRC